MPPLKYDLFRKIQCRQFTVSVVSIYINKDQQIFKGKGIHEFNKHGISFLFPYVT